MKKFTADFETIVSEDDCRVWAYATCEIGNVNNFKYGNSIEDFLKWCANGRENYKVWFHNLKYDGEYIFSYLLKNGYECIKDKKDRHDKTFISVISGEGMFYCIEIYFEVKNSRKVNKVTIYDSLKLLNFSVEKIAESFDLPIRKLTLDYKENREIGHELTQEEIDYIRNDVEIMARALEILFNENLNKMTIGACALDNYRKDMKKFKYYYPELEFETDQDIRKAYKGGFTYLSDKYKDMEVVEGIVLDVNSLQYIHQ